MLLTSAQAGHDHPVKNRCKIQQAPLLSTTMTTATRVPNPEEFAALYGIHMSLLSQEGVVAHQIIVTGVSRKRFRPKELDPGDAIVPNRYPIVYGTSVKQSTCCGAGCEFWTVDRVPGPTVVLCRCGGPLEQWGVYSCLQFNSSFLKKLTHDFLFTCGARHHRHAPQPSTLGSRGDCDTFGAHVYTRIPGRIS